MHHFPKAFIHAIASSTTEQELRLNFMDHAEEAFGVQKWGIHLFNEHQQPLSLDVHGVTESFLETYQTFGQAVDPVLQYVQDYHAPAHEELVLPNGKWKESQLYQTCCATQSHEHIMTGPIVGNGQLIGVMNFARTANTPAFTDRDLARLGAVCLHLSAKLSDLRHSSRRSPNPYLKRLTPREQQIAQLVAQGRTNTEIGQELWITQNSVKQALKRMFRKLEISSRAEMVAKLHLFTD